MNIQKWTIESDPTGRVFSKTGEQLSDNGSGRTRVVRNIIRRRCCGCGRPLQSAAEITGRCDRCSVGPLCVKCEASCVSCSRRLCRKCRHGFAWGSRPMTVCAPCLVKLNRRVRYEQRGVARKARLEQLIQIQRLKEQRQAARLRLAQRNL